MDHDHGGPWEAQRVAEQLALLDQVLGSRYRVGWTREWVEVKNQRRQR